jgi:hypothetical protein
MACHMARVASALMSWRQIPRLDPPEGPPTISVPNTTTAARTLTPTMATVASNAATGDHGVRGS